MVYIQINSLYVKLNYDGSFSPLSQHAGIGGIIRNSTGLLVAALAGKVHAVHSVEAELQPLITGIDCASVWESEWRYWKEIA